jgi:hypothetical protein
MHDLAQWRVDMTIACLLSAMVIAGWIGWRTWKGAAVLALISTAWLATVDTQFEGPVIWHLRPRHGVVLADLAGFAGLLVAMALVLRLVRRTS